MKRYNFLQSLFLAFYSHSLYRDVKQNWRGWGILYVLFLVAIFCLPTAYALHSFSLKLVETLQPSVQQFPVITLKNGTLSIDKPVPYLIANPKTNKVIGIFATSDDTSSLQKTPALFLVTKHKLVINALGGAVQIYDLSSLRNGVYGPEDISSFIHFFKYAAFVVIYILSVFMLFLRSVVALFILAGLAKIVTHTQLSYKNLCRLAAVALTPTIVLSAIVNLFLITISYIYILYFLLAMFYLLYGIDANKQAKNPIAETK